MWYIGGITYTVLLTNLFLIFWDIQVEKPWPSPLQVSKTNPSLQRKQPEIIKWATKKTHIIFHYTGCLLGFPKTGYTKPYNKGEYNPKNNLNNLNNQGQGPFFSLLK